RLNPALHLSGRMNPALRRVWLVSRGRSRSREAFSMQRAQLRVQIVRIEILSVVPGDGRESVVQIELREPLAIAQPFEFLAVQLVGEIDYPFSPVVEFQPNLVVTEIPRLYHVTWALLVLGHLLWSSGWLLRTLALRTST